MFLSKEHEEISDISHLLMYSNLYSISNYIYHTNIVKLHYFQFTSFYKQKTQSWNHGLKIRGKRILFDLLLNKHICLCV